MHANRHLRRFGIIEATLDAGELRRVASWQTGPERMRSDEGTARVQPERDVASKTALSSGLLPRQLRLALAAHGGRRRCAT